MEGWRGWGCIRGIVGRGRDRDCGGVLYYTQDVVGWFEMPARWDDAWM